MDTHETVELVSIIDPNRKYKVEKKEKGSGAKKRVFFAPDRSYAIGVYVNEPDHRSQERLQELVGTYYRGLFEHEGKEVWKERFCWPYDIVRTSKGNLGIVMPLYSPDFLFQKGNLLKGEEKKGSHFALPIGRMQVDPEELGNWKNMLECSWDLARTIRRLHMAGLSHSDLSYNNVLLNPTKGRVLVIDVDELVVPGKYDPGVFGTPGFIAPEVYGGNELPSQYTDLHAMACLIYLYLLHRHPLIGEKRHPASTAEEEELIAYGKGALFVEHSTDKSNKPAPRCYSPVDWSDVDKVPCEITGPYLSRLFHRTFEEGLHNPKQRPSAAEWEEGLQKTYDLLTPCDNPRCTEHYFVLNKKKSCPFCGRTINYSIPVFDVYLLNKGKWEPAKRKLYGTKEKQLHKWHFFANCSFNETLPKEERKTIALLNPYRDQWIFYNIGMKDLVVVDGDQETHLAMGDKILLKKDMVLRNNEPNGLTLKVVGFM